MPNQNLRIPHPKEPFFPRNDDETDAQYKHRLALEQIRIAKKRKGRGPLEDLYYSLDRVRQAKGIPPTKRLEE